MAKDLYVSYFIEDNPNQPNFFSFGFDTPRAVEGITKLLNIFLKDLFTVRGSDIYDLDAGTVLATLIGGNIDTLEEAQDFISIAIDQTVENLKRYQSNVVSTDEERIGTATLLEVEALEGGDGVRATIKIQNEAGRSLIAELPVT
jgi:hypothetical protein